MILVKDGQFLFFCKSLNLQEYHIKEKFFQKDLILQFQCWMRILYKYNLALNKSQVYIKLILKGI